MRGKTGSMDGLGELPDFDHPSGFYVPGERHENLPAGGFAGHLNRRGMGTPVQSIWDDTRAPEYATGSSGMFQGDAQGVKHMREMADFGHGKLIAMGSRLKRKGYGQDDSGDDSSGTSFMDLLNQGLSTVSDVAQAVTPQSAQAATPAQAQAARTAAAAAPAAGIMSKKIAGIPVVALVAVAAAGVFFVMQKKKKRS